MFAQYKSLTIVIALAGAYFLLGSAYGREEAPAEAAWRDANAEIAAWLEAQADDTEASPADGVAEDTGLVAADSDAGASTRGAAAEGTVALPAEEEAAAPPPSALPSAAPSAPPSAPPTALPPASSSGSPALPPSVRAAEASPSEAAPSGLVDVNSATAEQLDALPGIGPAKAAAIVAYRETEGPFRSKEDLLNVKGIGPSILAKIESAITVGGEGGSGK